MKWSNVYESLWSFIQPWGATWGWTYPEVAYIRIPKLQWLWLRGLQQEVWRCILWPRRWAIGEIWDTWWWLKNLWMHPKWFVILMKSRPWFNMCWGLNSHFFPMVGMVIKLMVYSLKGFPVKLGWPSPIYGVDRPVGTYRDCTEIVLDSTAWESRQQNQGFHIDGIFSSLFSRHFFNDGCHLFSSWDHWRFTKGPKCRPLESTDFLQEFGCIQKFKILGCRRKLVNG